MHFQVEQSLDAPVSVVIALFGDSEFASARAAASGALETDTVIHGNPPLEEFTVSIRRTMPTTGIRDDLAKLVGDTLAVNYTEVWEPHDSDSEHRTGTFAVDIVGVPARAHGSLEIAPENEGSRISIEAIVTANVPLVQTLVEEAITRSLTTAIEQELETASMWLSDS